jgi:hypothetical protein
MSARGLACRQHSGGRLAVLAMALAGMMTCAALSNTAHAQSATRGRQAAAARGGTAAVGPPARPPPTAKEQAPFDSTGYWVALVTEAWRFRMVVPGPGDYDEIPLTLAGKELADQFNPAKEEAAGNACKSYGAPVILWLPTRLHISWADDNTLRVDTDAGMQTRLLKFKPTEADKSASPSLEGLTSAAWVIHGAGPAGARPAAPGASGPRYGYIKAITTDLTPGYLRKNGVPYGGKTTSMLEYWEQHTAPGGAQWLIVTTYLTDPTYLLDPYVFSPTFRKEPDGSKWHPQPCSLKW